MRMTENTPEKANEVSQPPSCSKRVLQTPGDSHTPQRDASTPEKTWKSSSQQMLDEKPTSSETSCSSTTFSHESTNSTPKNVLVTVESDRALFLDSPQRSTDCEADFPRIPPHCPLPERPRRVESYPSRLRQNSRSTERHPSARQLRARRTASFYSSEEEDELPPSRRRSSTSRRRRRRSSMKKDDWKSRSLRFSHSRPFLWILTGLGLFSVSMTFLAGHSLMESELEHPQHISILYRQLDDVENDELEEEPALAPISHISAGLRGNMLHDIVIEMEHQQPQRTDEDKQSKKRGKPHRRRHKKKSTGSDHGEKSPPVHTDLMGGVAIPGTKLPGVKPLLEDQDRRFYSESAAPLDEAQRRVVVFEGSPPERHYELDVYPSPFTDNTQFYSALDSSDERLSTMELREPLAQGECVPMQEWQTTFHPSCNGMHEMDLANLGEKDGDYFHLFGTKGYWRNAWRVDTDGGHFQKQERDTIVLKTLKIQHRFEEAHFEHDRVDAIAMERLTSSPHVINIFGYCGHSVMTEYADGKRLGELADKSRKKPLARLRIARDIAEGLADLHGIDGEGNATLVHLDVNPANVVSVNGTLKLNDFNIGILRRWNTTSNEPCGFPAQYPNPQWRSPEEARNQQHLTEKVDVFSMGHIFFRLICGHEPWHKLEPNGRPPKEVMNQKVIDGVLPFIPDEVKYATDAEIVAIREAMYKCYTYDPKERPSAREITQSLAQVLEELEKTAEA